MTDPDELGGDEGELLGPTGGFEVTEPGRYPNMPDAVYHADPVPGHGSLSSTGARLLLKSPAKYAYQRQFGSGEKRAFDFGSAAHTLVLGTGPELVKIEGDGANPNAWQTNATKLAVKEAREAGKIPLRPADWLAVCDMAEALTCNPHIMELLSGGTAEEAIFVQDPSTGMWLRGKCDYRASDKSADDYKTSIHAVDAASFARTMTQFGYHIQFALYRYILLLLGLIEPDTPFYAIAQEKEPPYLAAVLEPDVDAMAYGHAEVLEAIALFQRYSYAGEWPGYPAEPQRVSLSGWKLKEYEDRGLEPVYTDRVTMAIERIADAQTRAEISGLSVAFSDVWKLEKVRAAANAAWVAMGAPRKAVS